MSPGARMAVGAALLAACAATPLSGQSPVFDPAGSVRGAGLNGAGAALLGDAGAIFSNPVGIATISHISLEGEYQAVTSEARLYGAAFAWRLWQFDFGAGARYFNPGGGDRDVLGVGTLIYRFGMLAVGGSGKLLRSRRGGVEESGASADVGIALAVFDIMALAFSVQNVSGNWEGTSPVAMPRVSRLGFTMNYVDPQETFRLMSTIEFQWPEGAGMRLVTGLEGGIVLSEVVGVLARGAYGSRPDGLLQPRLTYGASVTLGRFALDYAFEPAVDGVASARRVGVRLTL